MPVQLQCPPVERLPVELDSVIKVIEYYRSDPQATSSEVNEHVLGVRVQWKHTNSPSGPSWIYVEADDPEILNELLHAYTAIGFNLGETIWIEDDSLILVP